MPNVNAARGEVLLKIGTHEFHLVPSYERYAAIEYATGLGIWQGLERIESGHVSYYAPVIKAASASDMPLAEIGALILAEGITPLRPVLYVYMSRASQGFDRVNKALAKHDPENGAAAEAAPAQETKSA